MQDSPSPESHSQRRPPQLALASRWARTLGRALFGVVAPLVCFGVLLHASRETWMWPLALFVVTCVAAYVASWLRAPREDALDAALWGALAAATLFAAPWGLFLGGVALLFGVPFVVLMRDGESIVLLLLSCGAPAGFLAYAHSLDTRWRGAAPWRLRPGLALAGALAPGALCLALYIGIDSRASAVERAIVANTVAFDADLLRWRWIAPERRWGRIVDAWTTSTPQERARLDDAHEALTGRRIVVDSDD
jgi:hypothetical protein